MRARAYLRSLLFYVPHRPEATKLCNNIGLTNIRIANFHLHWYVLTSIIKPIFRLLIYSCCELTNAYVVNISFTGGNKRKFRGNACLHSILSRTSIHDQPKASSNPHAFPEVCHHLPSSHVWCPEWKMQPWLFRIRNEAHSTRSTSTIASFNFTFVHKSVVSSAKCLSLIYKIHKYILHVYLWIV